MGWVQKKMVKHSSSSQEATSVDIRSRQNTLLQQPRPLNVWLVPIKEIKVLWSKQIYSLPCLLASPKVAGPSGTGILAWNMGQSKDSFTCTYSWAHEKLCNWHWNVKILSIWMAQQGKPKSLWIHLSASAVVATRKLHFDPHLYETLVNRSTRHPSEVYSCQLWSEFWNIKKKKKEGKKKEKNNSGSVLIFQREPKQAGECF